jgi:hypothetical protein
MRSAPRGDAAEYSTAATTPTAIASVFYTSLATSSIARRAKIRAGSNIELSWQVSAPLLLV